MLIYRAQQYRIYPTAKQAERLNAWEDALRFLWNVALEQRLQAHGRRCKVDAKYPSAVDQARELTELRAMLPWLADVPRRAAMELLKHLDLAWQRCFKRLAWAPRFKRKGRDAVSIACNWHEDFAVLGERRSGSIDYPKIGPIPAMIHRPLPGKQKACTISRDGDAWFASVLCEVEVADPVPSTKPPVAIDRGVAVLLADSDRRTVQNPRPLEAMQPRIARAQRALARKKRGSKNSVKARARVASLQRKVRRQRDYILNAESKNYAKNHGTIFVEALTIGNMTRSAKGTPEEPGTNVAAKAGLNRAILDSGWGKFLGMLRYKAVPEGANVVEVPARYSSQTCAACGAVDAESRRTQDVFLCTSCGHFDNADVNAAKVLLARGSRVLTAGPAVKVCGGDANGRPAKQKLRTVRRGTHKHGDDQKQAAECC